MAHWQGIVHFPIIHDKDYLTCGNIEQFILDT